MMYNRKKTISEIEKEALNNRFVRQFLFGLYNIMMGQNNFC
jgi:hypothetical protein